VLPEMSSTQYETDQGIGKKKLPKPLPLLILKEGIPVYALL
jgi:hypothetical protein